MGETAGLSSVRANCRSLTHLGVSFEVFRNPACCWYVFPYVTLLNPRMTQRKGGILQGRTCIRPPRHQLSLRRGVLDERIARRNQHRFKLWCVGEYAVEKVCSLVILRMLNQLLTGPTTNKGPTLARMRLEVMPTMHVLRTGNIGMMSAKVATSSSRVTKLRYCNVRIWTAADERTSPIKTPQ